jgi:hypothetical protein
MTELIKNVIVCIIGIYSPCCAKTGELLFIIIGIGEKIMQRNRFAVMVGSLELGL